MAITQQTSRLYEFGPFRIDTVERVLFRDGGPVPMTPKVFDILLMLIENAGHVVEKDRLMIAIWPDSFVEEGNLTQNISTLRKALGEGENGHECIQTIARRGYRFVASVREVLDEGDNAIVEEHSKSRFVVEQEQETSVARKYAAEAEQAIQEKALPAGRWGEIASSSKLRMVALAVCVLGLALALSYFWISNKPNPPATDAHMKSIAVLPFKPLAADSRDEILGVGMAETLITKLSGIREIRVLSIEAVSDASLDQDAVAAGRELGVDYVLDVHLQMLGEKAKATARLLSVKDGSAIWTDTRDEQYSHIFELQDSIAERVAGGLALTLTGVEREQLAKRYTESTEAWGLYITGRYHLSKKSREGAEESLKHFDQAIKLDPTYAQAYAGLAYAYNFLGGNRQEQKSAAMKALAIDDNLAEAHVALSQVKESDWDWEGAKEHAQRALELNPNIAESHYRYAHYLATVGRVDDLYMFHLKRALKLEPQSRLMNSLLGNGLYLMRQYDEAIAQQRQVLDRDANWAPARARLGRAYLQKGMYDEAIEEFQKAKALDSSPEVTLRYALLAYAYAKSGKKSEAQRMLAELKEKAEKGKRINPVGFALIYTGLGDKDQAFVWLQKASKEHRFPDYFKVDPMYDSLRSDPRYTELLRRVNLAP